VSRRRRGGDTFQAKDMPKVVALEEKTKAVPNRDLRDLADTLEVARARDEGWRP
jgi:hypothetical protein